MLFEGTPLDWFLWFFLYPLLSIAFIGLIIGCFLFVVAVVGAVWDKLTLLFR